MGKSKDAATAKAPKSTFPLAVSSKAIDPSLASLFGSSSGPVKAPQRVYKPFAPKAADNEDDEGQDSATVDGSSDQEDEEEEDTTTTTTSTKQKKDKKNDSKKDAVAPPSTIPAHESTRKSKRKRDDDNLEDEYMSKLQQEEAKETERLEKERAEQQKATKKAEAKKAKAAQSSDDEDSEEEDEDEESEEVEVVEDDAAESSDDSDEDSDEEETGEKAEKDGEQQEKKTKGGKPESAVEFVSAPIRHETQDAKALEDLDKSAMTVFLGNLPSTVISSKPNYKILKTIFKAAGKISSIRFRSIAFSEQIPRKAAFVTHKLHEKQQTVNAYVVYKTKEGAREALKLNGAVVLDRHVRVDSVAHPAKQDATRCVFIGNLDFESQEESLWRHFAPCGKVESVRIVRDAATNVGKGFAYVQFVDGTSVEKAILMDGQKMAGDRKLRVSRAKNVKRKTSKTLEVRAPPPKKQKTYVPKEDPRQKEMLGRARTLLGKAGAAKMKRAPEAFVLEGVRANSKTNPGVKLGPKKKGGKPGGGRPRTNDRSSAWKTREKK